MMANDTYTANADGTCYAGMFEPVVVTEIATIAAGMSAGDIVEITTFTGLNDGPTPRPNEGGSNDLMQDWCVGGVWDPDRKRAYVLGAPNGKLSDLGASATLLTYDAISNHWFAVRNPLGASTGHCWDNTAYHNGRIYKRRYTGAGGTTVLDADTYEIIGEIPMPPTNIAGGSMSWGQIIAACVVPELGSAGSLVINNTGRVCSYDFAAETWSLIAGGLTLAASGPTIHYNKTSGKLVVGTNVTDPLYLIDPFTGAFTRSDTCPINIFNPGTSSFVECPNSVYSICYGSDANIHIVNTLTGAWSTTPMPPIFTTGTTLFALHSLMVTIHEYDVILIEYYQAEAASRMFLHKPAGI